MLVWLTVAGTPSSCLPPWLDTTIPFTPCLRASLASSLVNIPFRITGRCVSLHTQSITSQFRLGSIRSLYLYSTLSCESCDFTTNEVLDAWQSMWPLKLARLRWGGRVNLLRASSDLLPTLGVSTVTTRALYPAFSALWIKLAVRLRFFLYASCGPSTQRHTRTSPCTCWNKITWSNYYFWLNHKYPKCKLCFFLFFLSSTSDVATACIMPEGQRSP